MSLLLHKEKGVNPHLTYCPRCGGESPEIVLLGAHDKIYKCTSCGMNHIGYPKGKKCQKCGSRVEFDRNVEEGERLPGGLCKGCEEQVEAVKAGGIFFKCKDCSAIGAIKADAPIAQSVREQMGIQPPDPCGIEFDKDSCPVCTGRVENADEG